MMNEPIKLTKQLITFSLDSELIKKLIALSSEETIENTLIELLLLVSMKDLMLN